MNRSEACEWVHTQLIVAEMPFDDLVAAFTVLVGRVPNEPDRRAGLFRRCYEIATSLTSVAPELRTATRRARKPSAR
jgi:hypothetical protein